MALSKLLQISRHYPPGSDDHYVLSYLAKPLVCGTAQSDLTNMKLSAMKTVFDKEHGEETIPLICMLLLDCGDKKSSDTLMAEVATDSSSSSNFKVLFTGKTVEEDKRTLYNFRRLLVHVVTNLDSSQRNDMITLVQAEVGYESEKNDFQTLLLLFERATQGNIILPQKPDRLKDWLLEFNREDLIRYVNQFEPKKQFPGLSTPIPETGTAVQRQYSESAEQAACARKGQLGGTGKQESADSAYGEGDPRERSGSHGDPHAQHMGETASGDAELVLQRQNNISPSGHS